MRAQLIGVAIGTACACALSLVETIAFGMTGPASVVLSFAQGVLLGLSGARFGRAYDRRRQVPW
jgi:hypothetical protein